MQNMIVKPFFKPTLFNMVHTSSDNGNNRFENTKYTEIELNNTPKSSRKGKIMCCNKEDLRISKPLLPLKMSLFVWYGAGSVIQAYLMLFFKHKGLTIAQLSLINIINPAVQFLGPLISGVIADKIGKSKPVLIGNIVLVLIFINSMIFIPKVSVKGHVRNNTLVQCNVNTTVSEGFPTVELNIGNCTLKCFNGSDEIREISANEGYISVQYENDSTSLGNAHVILTENLTSSWCGMTISQNCNLVCDLDGPSLAKDNTTFVFLLSLVLIILFNTTFSNCYRFLDVTSMSMVKIHNSNFGRERIWCVMGAVILTPLSGYLMHLYTLEDGNKNYMVSFYMFDALLVVEMITVLRLDVQVKPPGEMMWKKTMQLLRHVDVCVFILSVLILGSSWGFMRIFSSLYLDDLGAPSMIYALVPTVHSVVGLPFLLASDWFLRKVGSTNLLILAFVGYTIKCLGYSFLVDPWMCLIYEVLAVFTYHLLWVAVVCHSHEIAPEGLTATVVATAGGIHYGIGKGTGSLIGGLIMNTYGGRQAFRVIAAIAAASAILLAILSYFRRKYKNKNVPVEQSVGIELNGNLSPEDTDVETSNRP